MSEANTSPDVARQLAGLARRLQQNPDFMAQVLATYQDQERLSEQALVAQLDTTPEMFTRLALCKSPDPNSPQFADQVRQIASYTSIDATHIANMVRQVESLQKLSERPTSIVSQEITASQPSLQSGLLAAARDHIEKEDDLPPPLEEDEDKSSEDR